MSAFIGRNAELGVLREGFARSAKGSGNLVLVSGEAGIGKTSLVQTFLSTLDDTNALVLRGACYDLSTSAPYGLWLELADRYRADDGLPEIPPVLKRGTGANQLASQLALFEVARDFFASVSLKRPLVLVLEDLHWADQASLELLRYLARQIDAKRVMIIASYRDDEITRHHPLFALMPSLIRETQATRVQLDALNRGEINELVQARWSLSPRDEARLVAHLVVHAEGNPLFTIEVLRTLEQNAFLDRNKGSWALADLSHVPVPALVQQVIEGRLSQMGEEARRFLEVAAVIGQQVPLEVWQVVAAMSDEDLLIVLEQAIALHLLEASIEGNKVNFVHALTREALYEGIVPPRRRAWHRRIAEMLARYSNPEPDVVAYHFQQADDVRAAAWLIRAGDQARYSWAALAAVERYKAALAVLTEHDAPLVEQGWLLLKIGIWSRDFGSRTALTYLENALSIGVQCENHALRAMSLWHLGQNRFFVLESGIAEMKQGSAALGTLTTSECEEIVSKFPGYQLTEAWNTDASMAIMHSIFGHFGEAIWFAQRYLANANHQTTSRYVLNDRGHAELALASSFAALGLPEKAEPAFQRMSRNYRQAGNDWLRAISAVFRYQYCVSIYYLDRSDLRSQSVSEVSQLWDKVSGVTTRLPPGFGMLPVMLADGDWDIARDVALPFTNRDMVLHLIAVYTLGLIARNQGERDLAWKQVRIGFPEGPETEPGSTWYKFLPELQQLAVELAIDEGQYAVARRWLKAHDHWLEWSNRVYGRSESLLLRARLCHAEGYTVAALESAHEALAQASDPRQPKALIPIHRFLGELAMSADGREGAERHLQKSLELAEACAIPFERALSMLAIAELAVAEGRRGDALPLLTEVVGICRKLGARPALERAERLAGKLHPHRVDNHFGLTARERDVLRWLIQGKSDKEIAEELSISHHTVMRHVSHILAKLDVDSRTAAAALAVSNQLV